MYIYYISQVIRALGLADLAVRILKYGLLDFVGNVAYQFDSVSKRYNEHLSSLASSVRRVNYGHLFFPLQLNEN